MKLHIVRLLLMALIVLPAITSCYNYDDMENVNGSDVSNYINVTLAVSTSSSTTRANIPQGGEDGDGREKGIDTRENAVDGVTLIFYQDVANINATPAVAAATTIAHAVYYTVELAPVDYVPRYGTHYPDEVYYTTGKRELTLPLSSKNTYRMLVVANADLTSQITPGTTTLADVRDMVLTKVYDGNGKNVNASKFVMSSEREAVIDFAYSTYDETTNSQTFQLENIHIERMAARIDYHAVGAVYSTEYDHNGYVYNVGTKDHFVLTSITPFNLNMDPGNGNEYIFKRTNGDMPYLAKEYTSTWVIDPYTASKTGEVHPTWMVNTLTTVESNLESNVDNSYKISMEAGQTGKLNVAGSDGIIIAYPKENTLRSDSRLYYHATGIAFEGYYYTNNTKTGGERRVFYHYLRHQGDAESYDALKSPLDKTATCGSTTPMSYGVVRNNIYRVSIEGLSIEPKIKIKIEEEKWRHVDNPAIYI